MREVNFLSLPLSQNFCDEKKRSFKVMMVVMMKRVNEGMK